MLTEDRFQQLAAGQRSAAMKVFDSVPAEHPWEIAQIRQDPHRRGIHLAAEAAVACLHSLADAGLIKERPRGSFARVAIKPATPPAPSAPQQESKPMPPAPPPRAPAHAISPIDRLAGLASRLRGVMDEIKRLASDIETAALEIAEQQAQGDADMEKLRQLQALLKSLGQG